MENCFPYLVAHFVLFIVCCCLNGVQCSTADFKLSKYYLRRVVWHRNRLTYALVDHHVASHNQISAQSVRNILREVFDEWQMNSCFHFHHVSSPQIADIKILFTSDRRLSTHKNCSRKFQNSAGHSFFRFHKAFPAQIHINNEYFWMESNASPLGSVSLKSVLLHEVGHVLGLFHLNDPESIMFQNIHTNKLKSITKADRDYLQHVYNSTSLCSNRNNV
jgi:predicted Zn-dependent protease